MATETVSPLTHSKGHLLRIVGVGFGIAGSIGGTVGSGILRTPSEIAAQLHPTSRLIKFSKFLPSTEHAKTGNHCTGSSTVFEMVGPNGLERSTSSVSRLA